MPFVINYLDELVRILYKKEYFGYLETAEEYVSKIYDVIPDIIKLNIHKSIPESLHYLGSNYIFYKSNQRTTRYVFFEKRKNDFLITGIINNHCEEAKEL